MRQLVYIMPISNNRASFYMWWKENLVKHQKVSKFYENDCRTMLKLLDYTGDHQFFQISPEIKFFLTGVENFSHIGWDRRGTFTKIINQRSQLGASDRDTWAGCITCTTKECNQVGLKQAYSKLNSCCLF